MTRIKRFYDVHEPNEKFLKYGVSITSEMAFIESLLLRKGHFLSRKRGRLFKKYFFRSLNAFKPRKKGTFFTFKKTGGGHRPPLPPPPPPGSAAPGRCNSVTTVIGLSQFGLHINGGVRQAIDHGTWLSD
jgi:hypothetical protein